MGKRGPKPGFSRKRISETWSPNLAYAIGLLATDGCLSPPFSLIDLTSNDREQLENFCKCLGADFRITKKRGSSGKESLRVQFKNVVFYNFLLSIGLTPRKSRTLGPLKVPEEYFFDFLRGVFDGDGCTHSYWDPRWKSSFMFYLIFASASPAFLDWLRSNIESRTGAHGHVTGPIKTNACMQLKYAKRETLMILKKMYAGVNPVFLNRKHLKIQRMLDIVGEQL